VELLLACAARDARQLEVGAVKNVEADHALVHALKLLVYVVLPEAQTVHYVTVLRVEMSIMLFDFVTVLRVEMSIMLFDFVTVLRVEMSIMLFDFVTVLWVEMSIMLFYFI